MLDRLAIGRTDLAAQAYVDRCAPALSKELPALEAEWTRVGKDLGSLLVFHDSGCGHSQGVGLIGELDGYIDELAWPESVILIRKGGLEGDHARDPIDFVINNRQFASAEEPATVWIACADNWFPSCHPFPHFVECTFMQGKRDINRLHLIDDGQDICIGIDDIARFKKSRPGAT